MTMTATRISTDPGDLYMRLAAERSIRRGIEDALAGRLYDCDELFLEEEDVD